VVCQRLDVDASPGHGGGLDEILDLQQGVGGLLGQVCDLLGVEAHPADQQLGCGGPPDRPLDAAVAGIGANATGVRGDIADLPDLDRLYAVAEQGRRVDVLFANAGGGEFRSCIALKGDSYRLKDRDLRRVPAAGTTEE
jgi:NAD(P)-dependent dehydrogenase (short-subunit alcohol dehydrogenase family)